MRKPTNKFISVAGTAGVVAAMALSTGNAGAVESDGLEQVPDTIDGEGIYVPWTADGNMGITIDGNLTDWAGVPAIVTTEGPMASDDPATNGELAWSVIAEGSKLYVSATITDDSIIAGQHDDGYWNEDSIEVYLNATDNLDTTEYGPGIAQVRFSAVDIGNTDPTALTLSGTNVDTFDVEGLVFETPDGWGVEGVIDFSEWIQPEHGRSLGFQIHANGASTLDRDLKLIWSKADSEDVSWENPSVFGTAVIFELGQTDVPDPAERSPDTETAATVTSPPVTDEVETTTTPTTDGSDEATDTTTEDAATSIEANGDDADASDSAESQSDEPSSDDSDWRSSPLLWIVPLGLGALSLMAYALSRRKGSGPDDHPDQEERNVEAPIST